VLTSRDAPTATGSGQQSTLTWTGMASTSHAGLATIHLHTPNPHAA
jgi:hypothetical protein